MSEEYGNDFVTLIDEDGNELTFEHVMTFENADNVYVALVDAEEDPDAEESDVLILRVEREGEEDIYVDIEAEEELQSAFDTFLALMDEDAAPEQ